MAMEFTLIGAIQCLGIAILCFLIAIVLGVRIWVLREAVAKEVRLASEEERKTLILNAFLYAFFSILGLAFSIVATALGTVYFFHFVHA